MSSMLNKFNKIYNIPEGTPFKRLELENALVEKYGTLGYSKHEGFISYDGVVYDSTYHVGIKTNWGLYEISTNQEHKGSNVEEALIALFIKYGAEPEENTEDFFVDNHTEEFHEIVKEVYKCN